MRGRLYLVDNRLYQLIVFGNKETIPASDINQFMGSFKGRATARSRRP